MSDTQHEILDSDKIMIGKKTKFLFKCVNCGEKKRMPKFRGMAESTYQKNQFFDASLILRNGSCLDIHNF